MILTKDKRLLYYKLVNNRLEEKVISPEHLLKNVGFDGIYNNVKNLLREKIKMSNQQIRDYRTQTSKISKYIGQLEREHK